MRFVIKSRELAVVLVEEFKNHVGEARSVHKL